jgi:hypothetical protein
MAESNFITWRLGVVGTEKFVGDFNKANKAVNDFANKGLKRIGTDGASAGVALRDFGRIAEDAGYGLYAIQNNIVPAIYSFQQLRAETGSNISAMKALVSSMTGVGGLIFAYQLISSGVIMYMNHMRTAKQETDKFADSVENAFNKLVKLKSPFESMAFVIEDMRKAGIVTQSLEAQRESLYANTRYRLSQSGAGEQTKGQFGGFRKFSQQEINEFSPERLQTYMTPAEKERLDLLGKELGQMGKMTDELRIQQDIVETLIKAGETLESTKNSPAAKAAKSITDKYDFRSDPMYQELTRRYTEYRANQVSPGAYQPFQIPNQLQGVKVPNAPNMKEFQVTDKDVKNAWGAYYDGVSALADTFKSELNNAWDGIAGHANSVLEKVAQNFFNRFMSRGINSVADWAFSTVTGGATSGIFGNRQAANSIGKLAAERY